jgi:uncharacterized membrane protein
MTQFEANVYDFVENAFGTEAAEKNFRFWRGVVATFMYIGFFLTLPFEFLRVLWIKLKERGVI